MHCAIDKEAPAVHKQGVRDMTLFFKNTVYFPLRSIMLCKKMIYVTSWRHMHGYLTIRSDPSDTRQKLSECESLII